MRFNLELISAWKDIQNYREWIRVIKREESNPKSLYNKFEFSKNLTYMIYMVLTLSDTDAQIPDKVKKLRVIDLLSPVNRYLDEDLQFAEYLVPEFSQIFENNEPTLSYVIAYRFAFKTLGLGWFIKQFLFFGSIGYGLYHIPWLTVYQWILSLI